MRMMKNNNNETVTVIGIDHGYGNMKTATRCFPSGVARYDKEPIFQNNLLVYNGMYYQIGEEHKEFCAEKTQDEDYYVLTLTAIARELDGKGMNRAKAHIAAGLPLTWHFSVQGKAPVELFIAVATQKEDFQKYLLQNESVDYIFRNKEYHIEFAGADIYLQGFAAAFYRLQDFKGINMLVDIGNGTMNIMYVDLITSDNPVVRYGRLGKHGLNSKGIEIMFPITPKLIICIRDPEYFWFDADVHKHFQKLAKDEIEYYNSFQVLQSYRYVFGKKKEFQSVSDIIKHRLELKDINREKILMG